MTRKISSFGSLGDRAAGASCQPPGGDPTDLLESTAPPAVDALPHDDEIHEDRLVTPCHVFVDGHAGLLLGWRQYPRRATQVWFGRVFWCPPEFPQAASLEWVPASRIARAVTATA